MKQPIMKQLVMKIYLAKDEQILSWDPENMDKYWQQCRLFDAYSSEHFIDSAIYEQKSKLAFSQLVTSKKKKLQLKPTA